MFVRISGLRPHVAQLLLLQDKRRKREIVWGWNFRNCHVVLSWPFWGWSGSWHLVQPGRSLDVHRRRRKDVEDAVVQAREIPILAQGFGLEREAGRLVPILDCV